MSWEIAFVCFVLIAALVSFIMEKIPTDLTAMAMFALILLVSMISGSPNLPNVNEIIKVFSNPAPLTIVAMFVISAALEKCGAIELMARALGKFTKLGYKGMMFLLVLLVSLASAFMNNTAVVVVLLPVVVTLSRQMSAPASKFLIPLSYASIFGGCCTAIGTSTNILVSGILESNGQAPLEMFELGKVGFPLMLIAAVYLMLFGNRLLPVRETLSSMLSEDERKEYIAEAFVHYDSELIGKSILQSGLLNKEGVRVLEVVRNSVAVQEDLREVVLRAGDRLVLSCRPLGIVKARSMDGFKFKDQMGPGLEEIAAHEGAVVEGVIGPQSSLLGKTIREVNFRQRFRMVLLAVHRKGVNLRDKFGVLRLEFGDTLLMMGTDSAIDNLGRSEDIILLDRPPLPARDMRTKMPIALGVLLAVVGSVVFDLVPIVGATLVGMVVIFFTGCLKLREGYDSIEWRILVLIYGMLALGMCMEKTGFSILIAENIVQFGEIFVSPEWKPWVMLAAIYICTGVLTEVLTNNATAVLMAPIAIGIASTLNMDPRPFVIATAIASSCCFSTPIGYQTNTYVYGVGGYRFSDFWKVGLPLNFIYFIGCVTLIPLMWKF